MIDKVAVTYSWNRMSYVINQSLSSKGIKVFTGDESCFNMNKCSLLANKCFKYPSFHAFPELFLKQIINYLNSNSIPYLIPTHEEIFIISRFQDKLHGIKTLVPSFESLRIAHKKDTSSNLADKLGISIPITTIPNCELDCISFFHAHENHIVLKYNNSNSSKGVFHINYEKDLIPHYEHFNEFILQEYVKGDGYGVSMLYNNGKLKASFTHKRLTEKISTGGTSTMRIGTRNEMLEDWARKILDFLSWHGVAMVEFKYDEKRNKGYFIEVNPRFWGSLALSFYSGMDFPYLYYQILKDGDVKETFSYKQGVKVKWLLGGFLGFLDGITHENKIKLHHLSLKADYYDDFRLKDPFIFAGELGYYLEKFLQSFQLNPMKNSLLNIDDVKYSNAE